MSRLLSHLNSAVQVLKEFKGEMPLSIFLKDFFAQDKKYGSKDRKSISALCYSFFRLGHYEAGPEIPEKILLSVFLCSNEPVDLLEELKPEWNTKITRPLQEKLNQVQSFVKGSIFPWGSLLSHGIEPDDYSQSFLIQPKLFIRIRPGNEKKVANKLAAAAIPYETISANCFAFDNRTKLEDLLQLNREYVVQDINSQRVGEYLRVEQSKPNVWDCCAASGGKSLMVVDKYPFASLSVSDIRPSILQNLYNRFSAAGIENYRPFVADLYYIKGLQAALEHERFDLIICDAPCTGSGTWGRTPEQMYYFNPDEIERYSNQQKKIVKNVCQFIKPGGHLLYITCSVFEQENEAVVEYLQQHLPLKLLQSDLLKGYTIKADTLFVALFLNESTSI